MKIIPVIIGPTCIGKTSLALDLCHRLGGSILSADSRQVIKYMDYGTGKIPTSGPSLDEKADGKWRISNVDVFGYDIVKPTDFFSAYDYAVFGLNCIQNLLSTDNKIIIVGGTGFYIDVLTGKIKPSSSVPDFELRATLESCTLEELQQKYLTLNLQDSNIDMANKVRLIRAVEKQVSSGLAVTLKYPEDVAYKFFGLTADNSILFNRADLWLDSVWKNVIEEIENLNKLGFGHSHRLKGLVYKSALAYLQNELTFEDAKQRAKFDLHAYIRRQKTYFKKNDAIEWFDITDNAYRDKIHECLIAS
jgi:tRNA dimethylallyltransferase